MTVIEIIVSLSMFFGGGIGMLVVMYISRISTAVEKVVTLVADIDKRVVRLETKCTYP